MNLNAQMARVYWDRLQHYFYSQSKRENSSLWGWSGHWLLLKRAYIPLRYVTMFDRVHPRYQRHLGPTVWYVCILLFVNISVIALTYLLYMQ